MSPLGKEALMAKFDVESSNCNVPVHLSDSYLLGMKWRNQYYVDLALPFGLQSAQFIFNAIANMVERMLVHSYQILDLLHYLDESSQCAHNLSTAIAVCKHLGFPLHTGKCVGHLTVLVVLGIVLDSVHQVARLPAEKLLALKELITSWLT